MKLAKAKVSPGLILFGSDEREAETKVAEKQAYIFSPKTARVPSMSKKPLAMVRIAIEPGVERSLIGHLVLKSSTFPFAGGGGKRHPVTASLW